MARLGLLVLLVLAGAALPLAAQTQDPPACAVVKEGNRLVHCLGRGESAVKPFTVSCAPKARIDSCTWDCPVDDRSGCSGICNASASGGAPGLVAFQAINDKDYKIIEGPDGGPWTWAFTCKMGERMSFKVRDQQGIGAVSNVVEILCGATEVLAPQAPPPTR